MLLISRVIFLVWICLDNLWRSLANVFRRPWPLPDKQRKRERDEFIDSIDTDAICALASKYNSGLSCSIRCRHQGSFNVCFVLDFPDATSRLVRLPIEPAVRDVWDKVQSEVYTMQYLRDHTNIPVPRVYAYGRSRLRRDTSYQAFIVLDYINGKPLTKKMLRESSEGCRRQLFGDLVDVFAQLRQLEFPQGGSLMPNATVSQTEEFPRSSLESKPKIVGAFSMRRNELQADGYTAPRSIATTATEFFREQYRLLQYMWRMPCQELSQEEAEREEFALHIFLDLAQKTFESQGDSFYLCHPDLRPNNIIVDDQLHICGVIDWEFTVTVPRQAFLPPSWITGYDIGRLNLMSEFMSVLSLRKRLSPSYSQLAQDWEFCDNLTLPMAYILLDPSDLVLLFYRCIYPRLYTEPRDKVVPDFFRRPENRRLQAGLVRRLCASERYTQFLKDNDLEDREWQQVREWNAETRMKLQQLREQRDKQANRHNL